MSAQTELELPKGRVRACPDCGGACDRSWSVCAQATVVLSFWRLFQLSWHLLWDPAPFLPTVTTSWHKEEDGRRRRKKKKKKKEPHFSLRSRDPPGRWGNTCWLCRWPLGHWKVTRGFRRHFDFSLACSFRRAALIVSQAPWQQHLAEIRVIDVPAKNLQETGGSYFAQYTVHIDISNYITIYKADISVFSVHNPYIGLYMVGTGRYL